MKKRLQNIQNYYWLHDVLQIYVDMSVWVIQWDGKDNFEWMELTPQSVTKVRPPHFEIAHQKQSDRDQYYRSCFRRLSREQKPLVAQYRGFYDLFVPLGSLGQGQAALYAGFFLKKPADWDSLADQWRKLTGRDPVSSDSEFLKYVRMSLKMPVLDEPLLKGVLDFFEKYYVKFLTGADGTENLHEKVNNLRRDIFAPRLPNSPWVYEALGFEKLAPPPWGWYEDKQLAPWMKEELGISQVPTTIFAVMPVSQRGDELDTVKNLILNYQIQRECFLFAKKLTQTVAENLQDYGVIFLTSSDPNRNATQGRLEIREKAEAVQDFIRKRFGLRSVAGIGRAVPKGEVLYSSYQEAVLALHLSVQSEKSLLFYDENPKVDTGPAYVRLNRAAMNLLAVYDQTSVEGIKVAADHYVREVLEFAKGSMEAVRGQFLSQLFHILENIRRRSVLNAQDEKDHAEYFCRKFTEADSTYRLIDVFKETLRTLSALAVKPLHGAKEIRLQTTLLFIAENYNQPLRLPHVAQKAGFSVAVFCRVFKQTTGMSFAAYLNKIRVERAKSLLKSSHLNLLQAGQACGFQTAHHFIRNFKRWTGKTPGDYRREVSRIK